jgi:rubrerythrin
MFKLMGKESEFMNFIGSQTEKNLLKSFAGESQARNRYSFFASAARKEGYEQIAAIFEETAENEREHAKLFFKYLQGGMVEITAMYPAGVIGTTVENLKAAAGGEKDEWSSIYPGFAEIAKKEGFMEIAKTFTMVSQVEAYHERRYNKLVENLQAGKVFKKDAPIKWKCRNCGMVVEGPNAPDKCPTCAHPQAFFEVWVENY